MLVWRTSHGGDNLKSIMMIIKMVKVETLISYHYACIDESTNRADEHHQLWVENRVPVGALVVSKIVTNYTDNDTVETRRMNLMIICIFVLSFWITTPPSGIRLNPGLALPISWYEINYATLYCV